MKYQNKSFSVGMPQVTQAEWDAIFAKKREARRHAAVPPAAAQPGEPPPPLIEEAA